MTTDATLITRRRLLGIGGAAAATLALPGAARAAGKAPVTRASWLERASFTRRVGQTFTATGPDGRSVPLVLKSVGDLSGKTSRGRTLTGRNDAFALTFKSSGSLPEQGVLKFSHAQLGSAQLFAVPGTTTLSVVVNRSE